MLCPWPTLTPSLATLSLLLACSSAGTDENTDSLSPSTTGVATSAQETTQGPSTNPSTSPTPTDGTSGSGLTTGDDGTFTGDPTTGQGTTTDSSTATDPDTTATTTGETAGNTTSGTTTDGTTDSTTGNSTGAPESCDDGKKNGDETAIDCGGAVCTGCDIDATCTTDADCLSGSCEAGICVAATCEDAKKNGSETDLDCGGAECAACLEGEVCEFGADCQSGVCDADLCLAAACDDVVENGDETDLDCGGGTCEPCGNGLDCVIADDCQSSVCTNNVCDPPSCSDGVQNGMETGIDCGGNNCAPCQLMGLILNEVDYDNVGDDVAEFVEIYNNTGATVDLANIRLVLVNGGNNLTYLNLSLAAGGMLLQGQYLVVGPAALVAPPGAVKVNFVAVKDSIQNGTPDGVALVDTTAMKVLDALSYEGPMTMTTVTGVPGVTNLVEGMALNANVQDNNDELRSLIRFPNGNDKDNAATDWIVSKKPTPGVANVP